MTSEYTSVAIASHNSPDDCWIVIEDIVYNVTRFAHPGGFAAIMKHAGKDCTYAFKKIHGNLNVEKKLKQFKIGTCIKI